MCPVEQTPIEPLPWLEIKALGEEEKISIASKLATEKAKVQQLNKREREIGQQQNELSNKENQLQNEIRESNQNLDRVKENITYIKTNIIPEKEQEFNQFKKELLENKQSAQKIASKSQEWVNKQTELSQVISSIQGELNPQITQEALLTERCQQLQSTI